MKKFNLTVTFILGVVLAPGLLFAASEVVIGYANISARVSPLWIAQEKGFFTKFGVNVQQVYMYIFGRGAVIDPSEYLHQYFRTGVTKRLEFSNPAVDAALQAEQASFDPAQRVKLLQKAMSVLMDEAPVAWLYQYQGLQGVSNKFDFKANPGEDVYGWDLKPRLR